MASHYQSKIAVKMASSTKGGQGSFGDLGPGALTTAEWQALGLQLPDLGAMRAYRLARIREQLRIQDCGAALLTDPLNVRYATDSTNMQLWCTHNPVRYAFVATEGPVILFDFHNSAHLSDHLELIEGVHAQGPSLVGVFGRSPATGRGYRYSSAMQSFVRDGAVWDEATLDRFIQRPARIVKGTSMPFSGVRDPQDRRDLIAYLQQL